MILKARLARRVIASAVCGALTLTGCGHAPEQPTALRKATAVVRVDQVGYLPGERKIAMLLAPSAPGERGEVGALHAAVVDARGRTALTGTVGARRGAWNARFGSVHPIDVTALRRPGRYRIRITGRVSAESPPFRIGDARELFSPTLTDAVGYFQAHRDGADQVSRAWRRKPAHLADRHAEVYDDPPFDDRGRMTGGLDRVGGPVDVEGGWYDAGDYLKFTHTTAYALIALLLVRRDGPAPAGLAAETRHGLRWLDKMWDEDTETLFTQVGIGEGLKAADGAGFLGDHDSWRLPQTDDALDAEPGQGRYYQRYRPVFRAAAPGARLSPNLAGRVAAAFALAAQVEAGTDPAGARRHLTAAGRIFDLAETEDVGRLVTAQPPSFYPERTWTDDLAVGAAELALAAAALKDPAARTWALRATRWAAVTIENGDSGPLSVYDLGVLADAEVARVLATTPPRDPAIGVEDLVDDLRSRLDGGVAAAAREPTGAAAGPGGSDYAARHLGYVAAARLYEVTSGDGRYQAFATAQRGVVLGANGWGASLVVGAGGADPRCSHDQIASLTPRVGEPAVAGGVVNGPNTAKRVNEILATDAKSSCVNDAFRAFDRDDARYTDDTLVSATSEPSIDFTATGVLAFALTIRG